MDIRFDSADRRIDDQLHPDRRGQVKHDLTSVDVLRQDRLVVDRLDLTVKSWV